MACAKGEDEGSVCSFWANSYLAKYKISRRPWLAEKTEVAEKQT